MHLIRNTFAAISLVALVTTLTSPAFGARDGVTGTIDLRLGFTRPSYGEAVAFATTVDGRMASKSRVYITVVCLQSQEVVYQWSATTDFTFPLVDQAGQGLEWDGSSANCSGTLIYRTQQGRKITVQFLDQTDFWVSGTSS